MEGQGDVGGEAGAEEVAEGGGEGGGVEGCAGSVGVVVEEIAGLGEEVGKVAEEELLMTGR